MPRPDDFTPELQAFCDEEMRRFVEEQRAGRVSDYGRIPEGLFEIPHFREAWCAGTWLDRKLTAAGCGREEIRAICFANGQKCAMGRDPWVPTMRSLSDYLAGRPMDAPGPELAEKLLVASGAEINAETIECVIDDLLSK